MSLVGLGLDVSVLHNFTSTKFLLHCIDYAKDSDHQGILPPTMRHMMSCCVWHNTRTPEINYHSVSMSTMSLDAAATAEQASFKRRLWPLGAESVART